MEVEEPGMKIASMGWLWSLLSEDADRRFQ